MSKLPTSRLPVTPSKSTTAPKSGLRPPQQSSTAAATTQQVSPAAGDASNNSLALGDRVTANGKSGTVAFIGPTKFADGEWAGIILDDAQGKNDGSYEGTRYFETEANRGLFCRPAKVQRLLQNGASNSGEASSSDKVQATPLADASNLSTSTSNLEKEGDADTTIVSNAAADLNTTANNQSVSVEPSSSELHVGDRVVVSGTKYGTLKYLGKIHVAEGIWCGIQLEEPLGKNDGSVSGKRYFTCQQRYGLFSPLARVEKVTPEMTQLPVNARKASISSSANNNRQLHRSNSQESIQSSLSEISTSSNSITRIPTRTPGKSQQQQPPKQSTNLYSTPNTKSLLTQAAATLSAVTPSSTQMSNLIQAMKDKDVFIEKLQSQREQDRLEFSRAAQQVDEMESRMLTFKQQYDVKEAENEQLKKDQYQVQQRLEDLEFQLEEYKLVDANKEQQAAVTSIIPEGHRLLSPKDIEIYDQVKEKMLELESVTQKLNLEKQTLQDEHRQELKRQHDLDENEYKSRIDELERKHTQDLQSKDETKSNDRIEQIQKEKQQEIEQLKSQITDLQNREQTNTNVLSEKETLHAQQLKEQQSKTEQSLQEIRSQLSKLQEEKEVNEKQTKSLQTELQRYQEQTIPEFEKQCQTLKSELTELQNRDRTANLALGERESHYEQQIKEYQSNIDQASRETDKIRAELKQMHEENAVKEKETTDLLNQIKQDSEKLLTESNDREHRAKTAHRERETHYEQQVQEYQQKLDQSTESIQKIQSELTKLQEEKTRNEKTSSDTLNALKHDHEKQYESLKNELTQLQDRDRTQNMASNERETHYEAQIKDYQTKRDQTARELQDLRGELTKFQEEKSAHEKQYELLKNELNQLQERDQTQTIASHERDIQIKDYQSKLEQSSTELQTIQSALTNLQAEKSSQEKQSHDSKEDSEKRIQSLQTQLADFEKQNQSKSEQFTMKDQQIKEYQSKANQLTEENTNLHQQIELSRQESQRLQEEFDHKLRTQSEHLQRTETSIHQEQTNQETLRKELLDLQTKYHDLQSQCETQLTSNEQLKNTNDNVVNEKQALIDQLTKQITDAQQIQAELIEKQVKQHADFERQRLEDKGVQEKSLQGKTEEFEAQLQMMKSQYLVETENNNLDNEQEKLRLKNQLQQALQANATNQTVSTSSTGNIKQLEYELTEARYQIEKLKKQVEANTTRDDRAALESQVNFLNDVIVDLKNTNESLKKEIEFQKNPFAEDEQFSQSTTTYGKPAAPRLYCDMCEVFDQHDTDDCPTQSSHIDDQPSRERVLPPPRLYCEKCEEFGHDCNEADETY